MIENNVSLRESLLGTWHLVDYVERGANGELGPEERPFGKDPRGLLIYTEDGHVSVQLMKVDRPAFASGYWLEGSPEEFFEEATGYLAYAGTFQVDETTATVIHLPAVALFPNWAGGKQERTVTLMGDRLTLETAEYASPTGDRLVAELRWSRTPDRKQHETNMTPDLSKTNKGLVLEAFDTLFNRRDYAKAERLWSPGYVQHSAHIPPGRDGLFGLVRGLPEGARYEHGIVLAEGDTVIVHGRYSGIGLPANWIAADIVRMEDGLLAEHWDVIQDEATEEGSRSGRPMFGDRFPESA